MGGLRFCPAPIPAQGSISAITRFGAKMPPSGECTGDSFRADFGGRLTTDQAGELRRGLGGNERGSITTYATSLCIDRIDGEDSERAGLRIVKGTHLDLLFGFIK